MSTTTNTTVLDQDTTPASPAPSTNSQAGASSSTIHLSSQCRAVDALLGYMTGLSDMMNHLQEMLNDRLVNQWDYIQHNFDDMNSMAQHQFQASMSSAVGTIAGGTVTLGTTIANEVGSWNLKKTLDTQKAEKAQLEGLDKFLKGGPGGTDVEMHGGDEEDIADGLELDHLGAPRVHQLQEEAIRNSLRSRNFTDEDLNSNIATKAAAIRNVWNNETDSGLPAPEKAQILKDLDNKIASKNDDIKATQTTLEMSQQEWAQWGKAGEALLNAGGAMGQAFWGRDAKMNEKTSMLDSSIEKSMEQAVQNADSSIKTFANELNGLADALQKALYVQQRA